MVAKRDLPYIREALLAERKAKWWHDEQDAQFDLVAMQESRQAELYTAKWHVTYDWAFDMLEWDDPADWFDRSPRLTRIRASIVRDGDNEEEAFKRAIPVEEIADWLALAPPNAEKTGRRRVVIRLFTWVIDRENEAAYDPEWLKIADDMSAYAATMRARRWAKGYAEGLASDTVSREIRMTQIEILWWTTGEKERQV